jgi:hypothetical protein
MPTTKRKTGRRIQRIARSAAPAFADAPDPDELLRQAAAQLHQIQAAIASMVATGSATAALVREAAGAARAAATVARAQTERSRAAQTFVKRLSPRQRVTYVLDFLCSQSLAVRREAHKRLGDSLGPESEDDVDDDVDDQPTALNS